MSTINTKPDASDNAYARKLQSNNAYLLRKTRAAQDIVNHPEFMEPMVAGPVDPERRRKATQSFRFFCETYGTQTFTLSWSKYHLSAIEKIESVVRDNAKFALAMPRGSGKSSLCHWAMVWSVLCGYSRYCLYVGATSASAGRRLESMKKTFRYNTLLFEDWPEIVGPIRFCGGDSRKAGGQLFNGEGTSIYWSKDKLVLPTLEDFGELCKWQKDWPDAWGAVLDATSIDGEIRGRAYERQDGSTARPDVAIVDDPQTRETAKNPARCDYRRSVITGDIGYLGGPDAPTGIIVPCTVIYQDDLASQLLNREKHPEFKGELSQMLESLPGDGLPDEEKKSISLLWNEYDEKRRYDHINETTSATDFYKENQVQMDAGALASWPERFSSVRGEISAIQSAMNLKLEDESAFFAEAQNEPVAKAESELSPLVPADIVDKVNSFPRGLVPDSTDAITAFVDISKNVLWYVIIAWEKSTMTGSIIDYGTYPDQPMSYFSLATIKNTIPRQFPGLEYSAQLLKALEALCDRLARTEFESEAGDIHRIARIGVDTGWGAYAVPTYQFCRRSQHSTVLQATKGYGLGATRRPLVDPEGKKKPRSDILGQWAYVRTSIKTWLLTYDANVWKTHVSELFRADKDSKTSITIFGKDGRRKPKHQMFCEQVTSEYPVSVESPIRKTVVWKVRPNADNHFLDCVSGCALLAHTLGAKLPTGARMYKTTDAIPPGIHQKVRRKRRIKF